MIYAGIDVDIITHEKALNAGVAAFGLWVWGMCYAQKHTTDGRLPLVAVMSALDEDRRVLRRATVRLCTSGLWVESADGSFAVFNYPKKNQTSEDIQRKKDEARERKDRWLAKQEEARGTRSDSKQERRIQPTPSPELPPAPSDLFGTETAKPSPPLEPVTEIRSRRKPETGCPPSEASAGELRDWAERWKIPDGHGEFANFLDHHRKSEARWRDWAAAWRTWLKNAPKFAGRGGPAPRQQIGTAASAPWMNPTENFDFGVSK